MHEVVPALAGNQCEAQGFNDSLVGGRIGGTLTLLANSLRFEAREVNQEIPLRGLELSWGGTNNDLLYLKNTTLPQWSFYTRDKKFLVQLKAVADPALTLNIQKLSRQRVKFGLSVPLIVAIIVLALGSLWAWRTPIAASVVSSIPFSWEHRFGKLLFTMARSEEEIMKRKEVTRLLEKLLEPLLVELKKRGYQPEVYLSNKDVLNAFALPGGYVIIYSEVIRKAQTAEEVQGVIAHEFAHVAQRHVIRGMVTGLGISIVVDVLIGGGSGTLSSLSKDLPAFLLQRSYSRELESEADVVGMSYMKAAGLDGHGMLSFFRRVQEEEKQSGLEELTKALSFASTHPLTEDRIAALTSAANETKTLPENDRTLALHKLQDILNAEPGRGGRTAKPVATPEPKS